MMTFRPSGLFSHRKMSLFCRLHITTVSRKCLYSAAPILQQFQKTVGLIFQFGPTVRTNSIVLTFWFQVHPDKHQTCLFFKPRGATVSINRTSRIPLSGPSTLKCPTLTNNVWTPPTWTFKGYIDTIS